MWYNYGTLLKLSTTDSIESNVEHAGVNVEMGTEQLRQARDYQVVEYLKYIWLN